MRRLAWLRSRKAWAAMIILAFAAWLAWPWAKTLPSKWAPLDDYLVYDAQGRKLQMVGGSPSSWHTPNSRFELLSTPDHLIQFPKSPVSTPRAKPARPTVVAPKPLLKVLDDDSLNDFVIDKGDHYASPETREELDRAIKAGGAMRATAYFRGWFRLNKPYYGEAPIWLCNQGSGLGFDPRRLQIRKDFRAVTAYFEMPKHPKVTVVAGSGIWDAQRAAYFEEQPIKFNSAEYWAVVYAGAAGSTPAVFMLDRVTIGKEGAEIVIDRPPHGGETCDVYPYWFYVPLGNLPDGPYKVVVRNASTGKIDSETTATLRRATLEETEAKNKAAEREQLLTGSYYEKRKEAEEEHGAAMQLRLERLAEFVHAADESNRDRSLLHNDVARLGAIVDWDLNIYDTPNRNRRRLDQATPGETPPLSFRRTRWDAEQTPWGPSDVSLKSIWMCDGTDAPWFAKTHYLDAPELSGALRESELSPVQTQIKGIWRALQQNFGGSRVEEHLVKEKVRSVAVAGKNINEAIDAAYKVLVDGEPRQMTFASDDEMWGVFVAERSFLIRSVSYREYHEWKSPRKRKEFMVNCSAYIGEADDLAEEECAPVTLAVIPLGKPGDVTSVGLSFACQTICCRQIGVEEGLLDVQLRNSLHHSAIAGRIRGPAGFRVTGPIAEADNNEKP